MMMTRTRRATIAAFALLGGIAAITPVHAEDAAIRPPAVAGQFYPGDSVMLAHAVAQYMADAVTPSPERPTAIVVPHAGYVYSAQIAADAFRQAAAHDYDLIVLLGTNHTAPPFRGVSIYPGGGFQTPLGVAETDRDLAERLTAADPDFTFNASVHREEHSIEVQVPFVQTVFPDAQILAAVVGSPDPDLCARLGKALAEAVSERRVLIVASSDLSHYPDYPNARRVDSLTLAAIATLDADLVRTTLEGHTRSRIPELSTGACGEAPILMAIAAARALGATDAWIISYANSGDTAFGQRDRVVGYGAVAIGQEKPQSNPAPFADWTAPAPGGSELSQEDRRALLAFARKTITQFLASETVPLARGFDPVLRQNSGAFVTLKKQGRLRGCIGHMDDDLPLCQVVGYCALQAAFNDHRFRPVESPELDAIDLEISVLTPSVPIAGPADIRVGRDGVILRKGERSSVFLPYVATEQGWDRETLLDQLCLKAGLNAGCWASGAQLYVFQAVAFGESEQD
ncbi:MAG TPA: AmmeMemoRadiSam system protein B [Acidobacteriota bacterium]|nr:AmmeMemoRadiSam system protein B [Acidobacteriota bacterium]